MELCDDEIVVIIYQFLNLFDLPQREHWVHPINQKRDISGFIKELRQDPIKFYNYCRMNVNTFEYLLSLLEERLKKKSTNLRKCVTAEERLFITLRFLATGERFQYMHFNFRIGATTAGKIVSETCALIWEVLSPIYLMTTPTPDQWKKVADRFEELWNYPNCCGAIDGKHVRTEAPWNCGSAFFNYKSFHSIILQAVVDAEGKFLIVDVGEAGRNNDSGVFMASSFGQRFMEQQLNLPRPRQLDPDQYETYPYVFVADEAYALHKNMMKPFARRQLTKEKRIYNYRHSRARRIVECAFGMMSKKFRAFELAMLVHPDVTKNIVLACCVLHNMIRVQEGNLKDVYDEMLMVEECDDEPEDQVRSRAVKTAFKTRDKFVKYFSSAKGSVPWQEKMAFC